MGSEWVEAVRDRGGGWRGGSDGSLDIVRGMGRGRGSRWIIGSGKWQSSGFRDAEVRGGPW